MRILVFGLWELDKLDTAVGQPNTHTNIWKLRIALLKKSQLNFLLSDPCFKQLRELRAAMGN